MANEATILQRRTAQRKARREEMRLALRDRLSRALSELLPGQKVIVFGSLTDSNSFHERSDIDLALFRAPTGLTIFGLIGELEERLGRSVDVVLLDHCRLKQKILREGETWTN